MPDTAGRAEVTSAATSPHSARDRALAAAIGATPSLQSLLDAHAERRPDAVALACTSAERGWVRASWARFAEDTRRAAAGFRDLGVAPGDHVAVLLDNRSAYECFVAYLGLLRRGATLVPLNPRGTADELANALEAADCPWLVAAAETAEGVEAARAGAPGLRGVVGIGGVREDWADWRRVLAHAPDASAEAVVTPDTVSGLLFTSGTTARPKAVVHTHRTAVATGAVFAAGLGLGAGDVVHGAVPFFTSSGSQLGTAMLLWAGYTAVVEPAFDAARMVGRMVEEGTTVAIGVPAHFVFMMDTLRARRSELGRVRLWDYGGAPMPGELVHALAELFPDAEQRQNYGMTETGPTGTVLLTPEFTWSKAGSIGLPMPLCETMVVDEAGRPLPPETVGEFCIRSPGNMLGYYRNPEATAAAMLEGGWVRTGDIGRKDAEGFLYYLDRLKDVINRGGLKVSSMEVEDALFLHHGVLEAAVVAVPHPQLGRTSGPSSRCGPGYARTRRNSAATAPSVSRPTRCRARSAWSRRCRATAWARSRRPNFAAGCDAARPARTRLRQRRPERGEDLRARPLAGGRGGDSRRRARGCYRSMLGTEARPQHTPAWIATGPTPRHAAGTNSPLCKARSTRSGRWSRC
jgi:acyl-CoA synthetase (AMP-forming)/AMP-acid ligase II